MENLTEESKAVVKRFEVHRDRCILIRETLGAMAAYNFHVRWKADPGSPIADKEFETMMRGN